MTEKKKEKPAARKPGPKIKSLGSNPLLRVSLHPIDAISREAESAKLGDEPSATQTATPRLEPVAPAEIKTHGLPQLQISGKPQVQGYGLPQPSTSGKPQVQGYGLPVEKNTQPSGLPASVPASHMASQKKPSETSGKPQPQTYGKPQPSTLYRRSDEKQISIRLPIDLIEQIKAALPSAGETFQEFLATSASQRLEAMASHRLEPMASPEDMKMILRTHEDIIYAYRNLASRQWNLRDDRIGRRFNTTDIRLIEIAMVRTIEKKLRGNTAREPIRSFNYFVSEIEILLEQQKTGELPKDLADYHRYVMSVWEKTIKPLALSKWRTSED